MLPAQNLFWVKWMLDLSDSERERVVRAAYATTHKAGETVVHRGSKPDSWIGVIDGLLKISSIYPSGKVVMFTGIPSQSWVAEGTLIKRENFKYDVIAVRKTFVLHIPIETFQWLLDNSLSFNQFMVRHLNERLGQNIALVEASRLPDPTARLARCVASLFNPVLYPGTQHHLPISQAELGELVGLSRQSTNNALKRLADENLVETQYGAIIVKDPASLASYEVV